MNSKHSAMAWSAWKETELSLPRSAAGRAADLGAGRLLIPGQHLSSSMHRTTRPASRNSRTRSRSSDPSRTCRTRRPRRPCLASWTIAIGWLPLYLHYHWPERSLCCVCNVKSTMCARPLI
ncbi:hypothetical protein VPH35_104299 [Triticum aestivum]|uniref:Uncharacterized protein n=1 Tax=Triticum turgidum subsp. durum TaxID=4567 RepID=A0A9R1AYN9_TRITD|nr:unnamed protein product [Triticum turgidum subsp. durum]